MSTDPGTNFDGNPVNQDLAMSSERVRPSVGSQGLRYPHVCLRATVGILSLSSDVEFIRRRYNRLAPIYPFFEFAFALPPGIRARAVARLELSAGDAVAEIGCGTGRNFRHLVHAVGSGGRVYGVDYSDGMLEKAKTLCEKNRWDNVVLFRQDARQSQLPVPVQGVLFSFSYSVIPEPYQALERVWSGLDVKRHVVIMDGPFFPGILGKLSRPLIVLLSKATVLGDPDSTAGADLAKLSGDVEKETRNLGTYHIWRATKT